MDLLKIGEASTLMGVTTQTLRNWDKKGKFKPEYKRASGHRLYTFEQVECYCVESMGGRPLSPTSPIMTSTTVRTLLDCSMSVIDSLDEKGLLKPVLRLETNGRRIYLRTDVEKYIESIKTTD